MALTTSSFTIDQILCENCALKYSVLSLVPRFFLLRRGEPGNEAIRLDGDNVYQSGNFTVSRVFATQKYTVCSE